jgi:hypothetical protein
MPNVAGPRRERNQMILLAMYEVSEGTTRMSSYEDIVVRAWKLFPQEFGLRGYVDSYPDASDMHKPLYGPLKRDGYVRVQNKKFGLTEHGLAIAEGLMRPAGHPADAPGRVRRDQLIELERLAKKPAVALVTQEQTDELVDTDLYDFYGVTVRTKPADFAGRVTTVDQAIDAAVAAKDPSISKGELAAIALTREALKTRWASLIDQLSTAREKPKNQEGTR